MIEQYSLCNFKEDTLPFLMIYGTQNVDFLCQIGSTFDVFPGEVLCCMQLRSSNYLSFFTLINNKALFWQLVHALRILF